MAAVAPRPRPGIRWSAAALPAMPGCGEISHPLPGQCIASASTASRRRRGDGTASRACLAGTTFARKPAASPCRRRSALPRPLAPSGASSLMIEAGRGDCLRPLAGARSRGRTGSRNRARHGAAQAPCRCCPTLPRPSATLRPAAISTASPAHWPEDERDNGARIRFWASSSTGLPPLFSAGSRAKSRSWAISTCAASTAPFPARSTGWR